MNWSPAVTGDVPYGVVTWTSTAPSAPAGDVTVSWVGESTLRAVPAAVPKRTEVAPVNPEPVTVTTVAPSTGPSGGDRAVTAGGAT